MDKKELNKILKLHKMWLNEEVGGQKANLSGADLRWANLYEANLSGSNLRGSDLCEANLSGANLRETDLSEANLRGADLRWANLRGADLRWANLRGADLHGADLRGANLRGANLRGADLNFSAFPLWCGSFDIMDDGRLIKQLLGHIARINCSDKDLAKWVKAIPKKYKNDLCKRHDVEEVE